MKPEQQEFSEGSGVQMIRITDMAAEIFFATLAETDSKVEALLKKRGLISKLTVMIATGVEGLDNLSVLLPAMQTLGKAHPETGARGGNYERIGLVFVMMLERALGTRVTAKMNEAWQSVFAQLSAMERNTTELGDLAA